MLKILKIKKIFLFIFFFSLNLFLQSCVNSKINNNLNTLFNTKENIIKNKKISQIQKKYDLAIEKYKNNEDVNAINLLIDCVRELEKEKLTLNNKNTKSIKKEIEQMISLIHIEVIKNNNLKNTIHTYRKENNKIINLSNVKLNVTFISDKEYNQEFITDKNGYIDIKPYFLDLNNHGKIKINFMINDEILKKINYIEFEYDNFILNEKIAFINFIKDEKNNFIETKIYDELFSKNCPNFKNLSIIKTQYNKIFDASILYSDIALQNFKYIIISEIKIDKIIPFWDKEIAIASFNLSVIDRENKKILNKWSMSHNSKEDNKNSAINEVLTKCYNNISILTKHELLNLD